MTQWPLPSVLHSYMQLVVVEQGRIRSQHSAYHPKLRKIMYKKTEVCSSGQLHACCSPAEKDSVL